MARFAVLTKQFKEIALHMSRSGMTTVAGGFVWLILVGTVAYAFIEGWSWLDALYATIITITTVGYGDLSPQSVPGRIFAIIFTLFAIGLGGYAISTLAAIVIERQATRRNRQLLRKRMKHIAKLDQHTIICGANKVAQSVAIELHNLHQPIILIDQDTALLKEVLLFLQPEYFQHMIAKLTDVTDEGDMADYEALPLEELAEKVNVPYLIADPKDENVLLQAGIDRAKGLIPCLQDDRDNLSIVVGARVLAERYHNQDLRIMSRVESYRYVRKLLISGAHEIRLPSVVSGYQMASHLINPELSQWWHDMFINDIQRFRDAAVSDHPDWAGKTIDDLHRKHKQLVIAIKRNDDYISAPLPEQTIQPDDVLILLGNSE